MWRLPTRGAVQASVVFDPCDRMLVADMSGCVQAFSSEGAPLWQRQLEGAISATPAVDVQDGRVFVGTHLGWVYALNSAEGTVVWRRRLPTKSDARVVSDLMVAPVRRQVVLSSWGGVFHALAVATGLTQQTWDAGIAPQAAASADARGNLYFARAVRGQGVSCVRVGPDGAETLLVRQSEGKRGASRMVVAAAPVLDENRGVIYLITNGDRETTLRAWSAPNDRLLWKQEIPRFTTATPALRADGAIVLAGMDGALRAFSAEGSPILHYPTGAEYLLAGPVSDAEGTVFLGDPLGQVHIVDKAGSGRIVFEAVRSIQARPAFDRLGNLCVPGTDRTVYVFRNQTAG